MRAAFGVEFFDAPPRDRATVQRNRIAPWLAEITAVDPDGRYRRTFLQARRDYADANGPGTRGIWYWWTLSSGAVYEAKYRTGWSLTSWRRRLIAVDSDGNIRDLTEEEVSACLNARSASTS